MHVIVAGGPCTGKTTLVNNLKCELSRRGYSVYVIRDWAREIIKEQKESGGEILPWKNRVAFEIEVIKRHTSEYSKLEKYDVVLEDGGPFLALSYCKVDNVKLPSEWVQYLMKFKDKVDIVLITDELSEYFIDRERWENLDYARKVHYEIILQHLELFGSKVYFIGATDNPVKRVSRALEIILANMRKKLQR